ncbi:helix-turn-helix domain-containing protein [Brevibacillus laterosporus]|uniref:helix-turn-helix domain-containing protein n=1 Tax=Brevibacillus laterosporus TaxID=1465 RepID=UPI001959CCF4|nr:helix-turn-helix transcriptional regulator [Brevibacillus laterosporus]MBM7106849.1 helix-turn-helix protein [Brevibacillus laterosporus]
MKIARSNIFTSRPSPSRELSMSVSEALQGFKQAEIAEIIGVSSTNLNRFLKGTRTFDLKTLDLVTEFLKLPVGYFYNEYIEDILNNPVRYRGLRIREFVHNCIRLGDGFSKYIETILDKVIETNEYLAEIYLIGKELEDMNEKELALQYYELYIENEKNRFSKTLALAYYGRFLIIRELNMEFAYEAAVRLGERANNLTGELKFRAFIQILNVFYVLDQWEYIERYSLKLAEEIKRAKNISQSLLGESLNHLAVTLRKIGRYEEALDVIRQYEVIKVGKFPIWAIGNRLVVEIERGQIEKIADLCAFCKSYPSEAFQYLDIILGAMVSNQLYSEAQIFLNEFKDDIKHLYALTNPRDRNRIIKFKYSLSLYKLHQKDNSWFDEVYAGIQMAKQLKINHQIELGYRIILKNSNILTSFQRQLLA